MGRWLDLEVQKRGTGQNGIRTGEAEGLQRERVSVVSRCPVKAHPRGNRNQKRSTSEKVENQPTVHRLPRPELLCSSVNCRKQAITRFEWQSVVLSAMGIFHHLSQWKALSCTTASRPIVGSTHPSLGHTDILHRVDRRC